ncbi:MAG: class I SAM-dependent methyltransferase [Pseudoruegeria sp.]
MTASPRLSFALTNSDVPLPVTGRILVMRPRATDDLSAIPKDRLQIVQGFYPDHKALADQGFDLIDTPTGDYSAALVYLPRSKVEGQMLIAQAHAATGGGLILVDGQKTDGVDSYIRAVKKRTDSPVSVMAKAHGKLVWFSGGEFSDWNVPAIKSPDGFQTAAGMFSADKVDRGSALLSGVLPDNLSGRVADLGAGWGYLSRAILSKAKVSQLTLIEAEKAALDCARVNIVDPRAEFIWGDATDVKAPPFDTIVSNPPFHTSRAGDPGLGQAFLASAAKLLKPNGDLWIVANRHLPYEATLSALFREVSEVGGDSGFKTLYAQYPKVAQKRRR